MKKSYDIKIKRKKKEEEINAVEKQRLKTFPQTNYLI